MVIDWQTEVFFETLFKLIAEGCGVLLLVATLVGVLYVEITALRGK